jgi:hypothetical protein
VSGIKKNTAFRHRALVCAALALASVALPAGTASAAGLFDFLFGGFRRQEGPPPSAQSYADPFAAPDRGTVERRSVERGPSVAYCVRLCDGQHFPVQRTGGASAAQACNSFCPASKTKVFSGGAIDEAVASDGARYADLANAFVYRQKFVANCTCNGKTPGGLAAVDVNADATLRSGDIVATNDGFVAFKGTKKGSAEFSPLSPEARRKLADVKVVPAAAPAKQADASSDVSASARDEGRRAQLSK